MITVTFLNSTSQYLIENINCMQNLLQQTIQCEKTIVNNLFQFCEDCAKMAALPQGAFVACKLREKAHDKDLTIAYLKRAGNDKNDTKNMWEDKKLNEYAPFKYNEKLMNSIWGFYNRYSPHNIKSSDYESIDNRKNLQQQSAVASYAIANKIAMAWGSDNGRSFFKK